MRNTYYVDRQSYIEAIFDFINHSREKERYLFVIGGAGMGKTVIIEETVRYQKLQFPLDISALLSYKGLSPLAVQLARFEDTIRKHLDERGYQSLLHETGSYLARNLYSGVRTVDEPSINVESRQPPELLRRTVIEISPRHNQNDILNSFCKWLDRIAKGIAPNKLVLFIDMSNLSEVEDFIILATRLIKNEEPNTRVVFSADPEVAKQVANGLGFHLNNLSHINLEPFTKEEASQVVINVFETVDPQTHALIWSFHKGNPLDTFISAVAASYGGQIGMQSQQDIYTHILATLGHEFNQLHQLLALTPDPLNINVLATILGIDVSHVREMVLRSPIVRVTNDSFEDIDCGTIFHSTAVESVLRDIPPSIRESMAFTIAQLYAPTDESISEYQFYALYPSNLIARLNLLRESGSRTYLLTLTTAATRVLLRQWVAAKYAVGHIAVALERYTDQLTPVQQSILLRDMGYFSQILGNEEDAKNYYEEAISILNVDADVASQETIKSVLGQAEALSEQADFLRKQGRYQDAIETLQKARMHYEMLLEVVLSSRVAIEMEIAQVTHNLGVLWRDYAGSFPKAYERSRALLLKALGYFEEAYTVENLHENVTGQIAALSQISLINAYLGHYEEADQAFSLLQSLCQSAGDLRSIANLAGNLAVCYLEDDVDKPREAEKYSSIATELFHALGDTEQKIASQDLRNAAQKRLY